MSQHSISLNISKIMIHCRTLLDWAKPGEAFPLARIGVRLARRPDEKFDMKLMAAEAILELGHVKRSQDALRDLLKESASDGSITLNRVSAVQVLLAETCLATGDSDRALELAVTVQKAKSKEKTPDPRLLVLLGKLERLQENHDQADEILDKALAAVSQERKPALLGRVRLEIGQIAWARGDLARAFQSFSQSIEELTEKSALSVLAETCMAQAALTAEILSDGKPPPLGAPVHQPAELLARARKIYSASGSFINLDRVRKSFHLYGRRGTDHVFDPLISKSAEDLFAAETSLFDEMDDLFEMVLPGNGDDVKKDNIEDSGKTAFAVESFLLLRKRFLRGLVELEHRTEILMDAAGAAILERNLLRKLLEGAKSLAAIKDIVHLRRQLAELAAEMLGADQVILTLANEKGDLVEKERFGKETPEPHKWRFLAETVRRTGQAILTGGNNKMDPSHEAPPSLHVHPFTQASTSTKDVSRPKPDLGNMMASPIPHHDRIFGVLYADRQSSGGLFTRQDLHILDALAEQAGVLLEARRITRSLEVNSKIREAALEAVTDGVIFIGLRGRIGSINSTAARLLKTTTTALQNKKAAHVPALHSLLDKTPKLRELDGRVFQLPGGEAVVTTRRVEDEEGKSVGFVLSLTPLKSAKIAAHRLVGTRARYNFDDIIGNCSAIKEAVNLARVSAQSDSTVLITGESGTGKEILAQAIHNASDQASGPFVGINCAAIPRGLLESELFGYEEGAFTGSRRGGQPGKFELAEGGTFLLDEIGDMPLEMQAKLLRVLQERRFQRVGGSREHHLDTRILATTNGDLEELVHQGLFRTDLLFRLKVIHIHLPALRERNDDIYLLVDHFLFLAAKKLGKKAKRVAPEVMKTFADYAWPGNIRELEHIIEGAVSLADAEAVELTGIPDELKGKKRRRRESLLSIFPGYPDVPGSSFRKPSYKNEGNTSAEKWTSPMKRESEISSPHPDYQPPPYTQRHQDHSSHGAHPGWFHGSPADDSEHRLLVEALAEYKGRIPEVAKALGISRATVYNKVNQYGINLKIFRKPYPKRPSGGKD